MVNPFKEVSWRPGREECRRFARSLIVGFPCVAVALFLVLRWRTGSWDLQIPLRVGGAGAGLGIVLYLAPGLARPFYAVWFAVACSIGFVLSNLLLAVVYYVVVSGLGICRRAFGRGPIRKRMDRSAASYWIDLETPPDSDRYFRQF